MPSIYTRNKETGEWEKVNSGFNYTPAETDPTLSLEGSPADAKATGDAINSLRQEVENIPVPDVSEQINTHNINENAHEDIRSAIPTTLSDLTDDSTHRTVTDTEKATWNAKSNFSGNYNDLTNKPTIPAAVTVDSALSSTSTNPVQNKVINSALEGKAASSHNHAASEITSGTFADARIPSLAASKISAGTFAGRVVANSSGQSYSTYCLRNTRLASSDTNPTTNGQICWTYG